MKNIKLLKIRSEIGAGTRGASLGIDALLVASHKVGSKYFKKYEAIDVEDENDLLFEETGTPHAIRIEGVVKVYERMCREVKKVILGDEFPLVLAADHASAGGTIAGVKAAFPDKRIGVIWVDAHGDLHSPYTSPSGNVHGMPLATALGFDNKENKINDVKGKTAEYWEQLKNTGGISPKIRPEDIVFFGVRDTEEPEEQLMDKHNIRNFTVKEVREKGVEECCQQALEYLKSCDLIYLSFDVDSMDSDVVSEGTGTPVLNGFTPEEAKCIINNIIDSGKLTCFEMVEVNPTLDNKCNKMAETAFAILENITGSIEKKYIKSNHK